MSVLSDIDFNINKALKKLDVLEERVERSFKEQERAVDRSESKKRESLKKSNKEQGRFAGGLDKIKGKLKLIAAGVVAAFGVAAVKAISKATKAAAQFGQEMANVATLTGREGFAGLTDGVLNIAKALPVALSDLTKGLFQAVSAGIEAGKAISFLDTAARAAVGGSSTVTESVEGLTAALNGFRLDASKAEDVSDTLFTGMKRGVLTFGELAGQIGNVSGLANEANLTLEETVAAIAALSLTTNDAARATTQLRGIIQKLVKPTEQGRVALEKMGVTFDKNTVAEKGFERALQDVVKASERAGIGLGQIFEDVEGLSGALTLTNAQAESFASILGDMATKTGASGTAFREMRDESNNLWKSLKQNLNVQLIRLGEKILPTINRALQRTVDSLADMGATPLESLLRALQAMPGADPELVASVSLRVSQEQLTAERDRIQQFLDENVTVGTQFETIDRTNASAVALGLGAVRAVPKETINVETLSLEKLAAVLKRLNEEQKELAKSAEDAVTPREVAAFQERVKAVRDEALLVEQIIAGRKTLTQIDEDLALVDDQRSTLQSGGPVPPEEVEKKARTISEEMAVLKERQAVLVDNRDTSGELIRVNIRLLELEAEKNKLLNEGVEEWERQVERARQLKIVGEGTKVPLGEPLKTPDFLIQRHKYKPLELPDADDLRELKLDPETLKAYEKWRENIERSKDGLEDVTKTMRNLATAGRSLLRVVDVFGDMSDELRNVANGVFDVLDNLGTLKGLGSDASLLDKVIPGIGIAAGAASILSPLFGGRDDEAQKRALEEMERLQDALKDNAKRVSDAVDRLINENIVGAQAGGEKVVEAGQLTGQAQETLFAPFTGLQDRITQNPRGNNAPLIREAIKTFTGLLDDLEALDIEGLDIDAFRDLFETRQDLGENPLAIISDLFSGPTGLQALIDSLFSNLGAAASGSLQGIIDRSALVSRVSGEDSEEALRRFIDALLDSTVELSEGVSSALQDFLSSDLSSESVRDDFKAFLLSLAEGLAEGGRVDLLGGLSPDDLESLIGTLDSLLESTTGDAGTSSSATFSRSITEVQSAFLTDQLRSVIHFQERTALATEAMASILTRPTGATSAGVNVSVSVAGGITTDSIRETQRRVGDALLSERIRQERRAF